MQNLDKFIITAAYIQAVSIMNKLDQAYNSNNMALCVQHCEQVQAKSHNNMA